MPRPGIKLYCWFFKIHAERWWSWQVQAIGWDLVYWWVSRISAVNVPRRELYASSLWSQRYYSPIPSTILLTTLFGIWSCLWFKYFNGTYWGKKMRSPCLALCLLYWLSAKYGDLILLIFFLILPVLCISSLMLGDRIDSLCNVSIILSVRNAYMMGCL